MGRARAEATSAHRLRVTEEGALEGLVSTIDLSLDPRYPVRVAERMQRGTWGWLIGLGLLLGCSGGDPPGSTSFGPGPWMMPGESGDPDEGSGQATEGTTGGADGSGGASSVGPMTTADPSTTSGMPMGSTSTGDPTNDSQADATFGMDDGGTGQQPQNGWWAHCIPNSIACDAGLVCLTTDAGNDGVCTYLCNPPGNPGSCGASPGGTTQPICLSVGGDSVCALGCDNGETCPGGMICINETDDTGPISICI